MLNGDERKKQMEGFCRAESIIKEERVRRLRTMTIEESSRIYDELCEFYYAQDSLKNEEADWDRIRYLVRRRELFDKLGGESVDSLNDEGKPDNIIVE